MIKLKLCQWGQTPESLLRESLKASHPRVRERLLGLYFIACGLPATQVAQKLGRNRGTVEGWVHSFNTYGPKGLVPKWKGQRPTLNDEQLEHLREVVQKSPRDVGIPRGQWTGRLVAEYIRKTFGKDVSYRTALRYLHRWDSGASAHESTWPRG